MSDLHNKQGGLKCVCGHGEGAHFDGLGECKICECCHFASRPVPEPSGQQGEQWPEGVQVWFCPVCGERMAGRNYELDELRSKCSKTKHKALAVPVPYVLASKLSEVEAERDERLKVPGTADEAEVEKLAKAYAEWSSGRPGRSGKPWDARHPKNQEHWRKVARVLLVAQAEEFVTVHIPERSESAQRADRLQAIIDALPQQEAVEAAMGSEFVVEAKRALVCGDAWLRPKLQETIQAALQTAKEQVEGMGRA